VDYATAGVIIDDDLNRIFRHFNPITHVVCVFDCCHSGTMGDLRYEYVPDSGLSIDAGESKCQSNLLLLSGCMDTQTAADAFGVSSRVEFSGALSTCLLECLTYHHKLHHLVTVQTVVHDVRALLARRRFQQIPVLTSSCLVNTETVFLSTNTPERPGFFTLESNI
jgi:hypothetical protein